MINELIKLATHLDSKGYHKEADYIDKMLKKKAYGGGAASIGHHDPRDPEKNKEFYEAHGIINDPEQWGTIAEVAADLACFSNPFTLFLCGIFTPSTMGPDDICKNCYWPAHVAAREFSELAIEAQNHGGLSEAGCNDPNSPLCAVYKVVKQFKEKFPKYFDFDDNGGPGCCDPNSTEPGSPLYEHKLLAYFNHLKSVHPYWKKKASQGNEA